MEDIAPALLEQIRQKFTAAMAADQKLKGLFQAIQSGAATYADAGEYAGLVGQLLSGAIESVLTPDALPDGKLYYNIAEKIFQPMLEEDHRISSQAAAMVQKALNEKAGIGLQAQTAAISQDRIDGILEYACAADPAEMKLSPVLDNFSRNTVDETLKANADFHSNVGFSPVIVRRMVGGGCKWCRSLVGIYDYPDKAPKDIFRRHENCRCTVEYDPGTGKRQNAHTKKWTSQGKSAKISQEDNTIDGTGRKYLQDIQIGKSLGAKSKNYKVMDLKTGEFYEFAEGTKITNVQVFAGLGRKKTYNNAYKYADKIGGKPEEWQHVKGNGILSTPDGDIAAEVHWSRHKEFGDHDFFIKRWLE